MGSGNEVILFSGFKRCQLHELRKNYLPVYCINTCEITLFQIIDKSKELYKTQRHTSSHQEDTHYIPTLYHSLIPFPSFDWFLSHTSRYMKQLVASIDIHN